NMTDFSGDNTGDLDNQQADTRVRLFYTAALSDEIKLVTAFEMDAIYGDTGSGESERGDIGADGVTVEVKHAYADINQGDFNLKLGTQPITLARGFLFDDDFSGAVVTYMHEDMNIPLFWVKAYEGGTGDDANDFDVDYYGVNPTFTLGDIQLNPVLIYIKSKDAQNWGSTVDFEALELYFLGVSLDYSQDMFSLWFTGIYEGGKKDELASGDEQDVAASLAALGGSFDMDMLSVHAQTFYASGDDDADDNDATDFFVPKGQSYYWSEIMGYGLIDEVVSSGSPADAITNIMVFNIGVTVPLGKLALMFDIWNANLVEDNAAGDRALGTEFDLAASYQMKENLKLQAVAAYLAAGDATGGGDEDPMAVGAQISLSF
ncbi:MAG: hypothetical protein KJO26_00360, partial [Deltaproteobacteria bacterium]|nr:hypothetical protein [Deltaproteobacteria bacterium]